MLSARKLKIIGGIQFGYAIVQMFAACYYLAATNNWNGIIFPLSVIFIIMIGAIYQIQGVRFFSFINGLIFFALAFKFSVNYQLSHAFNIGLRYEKNFFVDGYGLRVEFFSFLILGLTMFFIFFKQKRSIKNEIDETIDGA